MPSTLLEGAEAGRDSGRSVSVSTRRTCKDGGQRCVPWRSEARERTTGTSTKKRSPSQIGRLSRDSARRFETHQPTSEAVVVQRVLRANTEQPCSGKPAKARPVESSARDRAPKRRTSLHPEKRSNTENTPHRLAFTPRPIHERLLRSVTAS